ncbi:sugar diacid recognition domain-containing protein [Paenibacillus qinlingensis]|uniref:Carbohydrate diacid regulator n=1 Tax=Paenibacillus qinlingensis TaxID=1837343 RepID=A0ABU1P2I0_9BACL|nr:sugar diacid recognition domain-containing protein [Paenibacillus qinlingensis]MDR6553953.1 carbohydrate diacid regulator [Paenibacillus qinlingensis]
MLTRDLAQEIVEETMRRLDRNINIMDENGSIIASGDAVRLDTYHEAAAEVIRTGQTLVISPDNQGLWRGANVGVNLPIMFQNRTVGVIGVTGAPEEILPYGELVKMTTEMMLKQNYLKLQTEWQQITMDIVVEELIRAENQNLQGALHRLDTLKMTMKPPYQLAVVYLPNRTSYSQSVLRMAESIMGNVRLVSSFLNVHTWVIVFYDRAEARVRRDLERLQDLLRNQGIEAQSGMSSSVCSFEDIAYAYQEACAALKLGLKQGRVITGYLEVETQALLSEVPTESKERFMGRHLPKLPEKLLVTLRVFLECNLNIARTAERLEIHRNSLVYRLTQVKELTGYDPQLFQDAISLQFLVWLKE